MSHAFGRICLSAVAEELRAALVGGRIDKIYQPGRDEVVLAIRGTGETSACSSRPVPTSLGPSSPL